MIRGMDNLCISRANRSAISAAHIRYWQVAEAAGISAGTLTLWFRMPLTVSRKQLPRTPKIHFYFDTAGSVDGLVFRKNTRIFSREGG